MRTSSRHGPHAAIGPLIELFISSHVNGREPMRPKTAIWPPVSSTPRSRSRPLDNASAGRRGVAPGDELRLGLRRKAVELGLAVRRRELHHLEAVDAVGDVREQRRVGRADDDVARVVQLAVGGEFRDAASALRPLDVDDREPSAPAATYAYVLRDVDAAARRRAQRARCRPAARLVGSVTSMVGHAFVVEREQIAELQRASRARP